MTEIFADNKQPYVITFAEMVTVVRKDRFVFSQESGRRLCAFIHVMEGVMEYSFLDDSESILAGVGRTVFIPEGTRYLSIYGAEQTRVMIVQFGLQTDEPLGLKSCLLPVESARYFRGSQDPNSQYDFYHCMSTAYGLFGLMLSRKQMLPVKYRRILPAVEAIERDPKTAHPVECYAALCQMSVPGFRRSFKEYTGLSPVEYRNDLRLDHARKLIVSGEFSVESAAQESGFTNLSFFYRLFHRKYGVRPGSI